MLAKDFAERGWIRTLDAGSGLFEAVCIKCDRRQVVIEPVNGDGGPDLKTIVEEYGWSFPVKDGKKICLCPFCSGCVGMN